MKHEFVEFRTGIREASDMFFLKETFCILFEPAIQLFSNTITCSSITLKPIPRFPKYKLQYCNFEDITLQQFCIGRLYALQLEFSLNPSISQPSLNLFLKKKIKLQVVSVYYNI